MVRHLHGDAVLWVGEDATSALGLKRAMVRAGFFLGPCAGGENPPLPCLDAHVDELPFQSRTLDGVVLHHALERVADPRTALREVARVLAPGGRVLVCGFNPWSAFGMRRAYAKLFPDILSDHRFVNPLRMFDWLTLLGLELEFPPLYAEYRPPLGQRRSLLEVQEKSLRKLAQQSPWRMPFGGILLVSAVKQANAMRPSWRRNAKETRRLAPVAYPRVASWQRVQDDA
jgi:SAM-dependent methyltransferase